MHNVYQHTQEELPPSTDEEEFQECEQFNTDQDLEPPTDDILEFITSQDHSDDQLDQVLQTYQAYQQSQSQTETPPRQMNAHITYHVAQAKQAKHGSLVDRGANGGLAGSDVRILSTSPRKCTVTGIDNHEIPGLDLVQCAALVQTNHGIVKLIMNEYAYYGRGHSIHSSGRIEWYTNTVDDKSVQVGGQQRIVTVDGYSMPLVCKGGLMYLQLQGIPADQDLQNYPSVHLTCPHEWDPSVLDYEHPENNGEPDWAIDPNKNFQFDPNFDEFGEYVNRSLSILDILDETPKTSPIHNLLVNKHVFQRTPVDYEKLRPFFGWVNSDIVKQTIDQTTQWGVALDSFPMKRHLKSRNPALNVPRRHEPVATDTIFSDTPAVESGVKQAQVFVGRDSLVADVYPMKSGKQFVNTLEDNIRRRGAMDKLLSDSAKTEISKKVMDILRAYHISNWHSEP